MNILLESHLWVVFFFAALFLCCILSELMFPEVKNPPMWRKPRGFFSILVWIMWWEVTVVVIFTMVLVHNRWDFWNDDTEHKPDLL